MAKVYTIEQLIERISIQRDRLKSVIKIWRGVQQEVSSMRKSLISETNVATNAETDLVAADAILAQFVTDMQALSFVNAYEARPGKVVSDVAGSHADEGSLFHHWNITANDNGFSKFECESRGAIAVNVISDNQGTPATFVADSQKWMLVNPEDEENNAVIEIENNAGDPGSTVSDPEADTFWSTAATSLPGGVTNLIDTKMILRLFDV